MSSEPTKKPSQLWFYSYLVELKYHGRYEKLQIFIIVYVVVFHYSVIFRKHAIAETLINQVVIDIEGCDKHEIEAFVKSFNLVWLKTNFRKFSIQNIFEIRIFKKTYLFKLLKNITKTVHYLGLTYGKFHSGIWMLKICSLDMEWPMYDVKISGFTRSSICINDIIRLRVNVGSCE
jgi:hypothetical protein